MDYSVIEHDPLEVKKYLQNFVPINYYRVLGDEYLYQLRATLLHSVSLEGAFTPNLDERLSNLNGLISQNRSSIHNLELVWNDNYTITGNRIEILETFKTNALTRLNDIDRDLNKQKVELKKLSDNYKGYVDTIYIGGRNLMPNSQFIKGYDVVGQVDISRADNYAGVAHRIVNTGDESNTFGIEPLMEYRRIPLFEGSTFTMSFHAYGDITLLNEVYITQRGRDPIKLPSIVIDTSLAVRRELTFISPTGGEGIGIIIGASGYPTGSWFNLTGIKIESGNKSSDWTPAPEDVGDSILKVDASINEVKRIQISATEATAEVIRVIQAEVGSNSASITEESRVRANEFGAIATKTTALEVRTGETESSIIYVAEAITEAERSQATVNSQLFTKAVNAETKISNLERVTASTNDSVAKTEREITAKLNGLAIGGRNLLKNSEFLQGYLKWGNVNITDSQGIYGKNYKMVNTGAGYFGITPTVEFSTIPLVTGKSYILSFYAWGNIDTLNEIWLKSETDSILLEPQSIGDSMLYRTVIKFVSTFTTNKGSIVIGASGYPINSFFELAAVQVEEGNVATDWTPAPEDSGSVLIEVNSKITEVNQTIANEREASASARRDIVSNYESGLGDVNIRIAGSVSRLDSVEARADGAEARSSLQVQAGNKITGMYLNANSSRSDFDIVAPNFSISPNLYTAGVKPFRVVGNRVYMTEAIIEDGTIYNAKIANLSVTNLKVAGNAISTEKIVNNAVSDIESIYDNTQRNGGFNTNSVSLDSGGAKVLITLNLYALKCNGYLTVTFPFSSGGYGITTQNFASVTESYQVSVSPGSGMRSFSCYVNCTGSLSVAAYNLTVMVLKK